MRRVHIFIISGLLMALGTLPVEAFGWKDSRNDLGDGYGIIRLSSLEVCVKNADGAVIFNPLNYGGVGPLELYSLKPGFIFTKNAGLEETGDGDPAVDSTRHFYFVIHKGTDEVEGPFSEAEFINHSEVGAEANTGLDWQAPRRLNIDELPFHKKVLMFLLFAFIGFLPFLMVLGVSFILFLLIRRFTRKPDGSGGPDPLPPPPE